MNGRRVPAGRLRRIGAAACGALAVLLVASCTSEQPPKPNTATVQRAAVTSGVSATGSISAASQQNMGFPNGGQLTNVFVKVGDRVEPGQVLATIDDGNAVLAIGVVRIGAATSGFCLRVPGSAGSATAREQLAA